MRKILSDFWNFFTFRSQNAKTSDRLIGITQNPHYASYIEPILKSMSDRQLSTSQILVHLKQFNSITCKGDFVPKRSKPTPHQNFNRRQNQNYESTFNNRSNYQPYNKNVLLELYQKQIPAIFGDIAWFVLKINSKSATPQIPIIYSGSQKRIDLKKEDVLYLMCLMALNLVPSQTYLGRKQNFNRYNNFSYIFTTNNYKTQCIIEYFRKCLAGRKNQNLNQSFIIRRQLQTANIHSIIESMKDKPLCEVLFQDHDKSIEDFTADSLKIDFANKFIGGGALGNGCVQEQIMFANHPELYVTILLCEQMKQNEALFFSGFTKYFKNKNYGYQTQFDGKETSTSKTDHIVAIDAINFKGYEMDQFNEKSIDREILKAYVGFKAEESNRIATGNWGCGAFAGNISLKFLIQWIACSLAGKTMIYCPCRSNNVLDYKHVLMEKKNKRENIGQLYRSLIKTSKEIEGSWQNVIGRMQSVVRKPNPDNFQKKSGIQQVQKYGDQECKSVEGKLSTFKEIVFIIILIVLLMVICYYAWIMLSPNELLQKQKTITYKHRLWG